VNNQLILPNLIIAGVHKAGTTSLFMYLASHADICVSDVKETQYFLPIRYGEQQLPPVEEYSDHFNHYNNEKYIMEATLGYFYGGKSIAQAIHSTLPNAKIILIFRDPIDRLLSFYKFKKSMLELDKKLSLEEYIHICEQLPPAERRKRENNVYWGIEGGFYADYITNWFDVFGEDNLKILFFENLKRDPISLLVEICNWLNIEHEMFIDSLDFSVENKTTNFRLRSLQKFALWVNWQGEAFWRSNPVLKKNLRRIYYLFNSAPQEEINNDEVLNYLEILYTPYNNRLREELITHGYNNLPNWLL
jgi:hypothetical protein